MYNAVLTHVDVVYRLAVRVCIGVVLSIACCAIFVVERLCGPVCQTGSVSWSVSYMLLASVIVMVTLTFSMPLQHQSIVGSSRLHNVCLPCVHCCCLLRLEFAAFWYSCSFSIARIQSSSLFQAGLQFHLAVHTSASDSAYGWHCTL